MTREKALAASRALDAVDGFQLLMDEIHKAVTDSEEYSLLSTDFKIGLTNLLENELARLNKVLEEL